MIKILFERERYFSGLYDGAAFALEQNHQLRAEHERDVQEITQLKSIIADNEAEISKLKHRIADADKQLAQYKKIINKDIAHATAVAMQESIPQPGVNSDESVAQMQEIGAQRMQDLVGAMITPTPLHQDQQPVRFDPVSLFRSREIEHE